MLDFVGGLVFQILVNGLGHTDDAVQRRSQLVRGVGEELVLELVQLPQLVRDLPLLLQLPLLKGYFFALFLGTPVVECEPDSIGE